VVICHHGMRSQQAGHYLMQMGFKQVINLVGGIDAWAREVDTTTPTY
ncbi:MAG: rhodanese-related sulfurtransferase, partial [Halothiobacillaceae bacterium]